MRAGIPAPGSFRRLVSNAQSSTASADTTAAIAAALLTLTVRSAAGVPSGAPTGTELPIAFDSTAITGGVYYWNGAAWVKGGTI